MTNDETGPVSTRTISPDNSGQVGLRPMMTLISATLQATSISCDCKTCQLVRGRAEDLIPLLARFSDGVPG